LAINGGVANAANRNAGQENAIPLFAKTVITTISGGR
jgi:hypothetical protein